MKRRWNKTKMLSICLLAVLLIWCCRIAYVNIFYKKPVSVTNRIGESFSYKEFSIVVNGIQKYNIEEWMTYYKDNYGIEVNKADDNGFVIVVDYTVKNVSDKTAKFSCSNTYAQAGALFNGYAITETNMLSNSANVSSKEYAPGDAQNIRQVYYLYQSDLTDKKYDQIKNGKVEVKICEYSYIHTIWSE